MSVESILEGLSQEERLALLERLVKETEAGKAPQAPEARAKEDLTVEDRIARLEQAVLGEPSPAEGCCPAGGPRRWRMRGRGRGGQRSRGRGPWSRECC